MLSGETINTNFIVIGLTRSGLKHMINHTQGDHCKQLKHMIYDTQGDHCKQTHDLLHTR